MWLVIALCLLWLLKTEFQVQYTEDEPGINRSWADLLLQTYQVPQARGARVPLTNINVREQNIGKDADFILKITLCHDRAWAWYDTIIESLAVGIYLYATFVLASSLFISGSAGITYMTTMVLCLSAIRVLASV